MSYQRGNVFTMIMSAVYFGVIFGGMYHFEGGYVAGSIIGAIYGIVFAALLELASRLGLTQSWFHDLLASIVLTSVTILAPIIYLVSFEHLTIVDIVHVLFISLCLASAFALGARPVPANWSEFFSIRITCRRE